MVVQTNRRTSENNLIFDFTRYIQAPIGYIYIRILMSGDDSNESGGTSQSNEFKYIMQAPSYMRTLMIKTNQGASQNNII